MKNIKNETHKLMLITSYDAENAIEYEALKARRRVKTLRRILRAFQRNVKGKP